MEQKKEEIHEDRGKFDVDLELDSHRDRMADQLKSYDKFIMKSVPLNEKDSHQPLLQMQLEVDKEATQINPNILNSRRVVSRSRIDS